MSEEKPDVLERAVAEEGTSLTERAIHQEGTEVTERPLNSLVMLRDQLQRLRIQESNRTLAATKEGRERAAQLHGAWYERLHEMEKEVEKSFTLELVNDPSWPWLKSVRGVGPALAAQILAEIDWERCPTVSALWRYAGLAVIDGKAERTHKGEKRHYNGRLKTIMYRWAGNQLKNGGPYEPVYRQARARYEASKMSEALPKEERWTKARCHLAALRKAEKLFLSHLWEVARTQRGLPVRPSYVEQYGGPEHDITDPYEFVAS